MTPGPSICARRRKGVARNRVLVVMRHGLSPPVPLCRSRQSVARNRPIRAEGASRHRASNPFAAELPNTGAFSCRILSWPVREGPPASLYANPEGCGEKHTVSPPATYAVQRFPVRHVRADSGWGGRVSASHRTPLWQVSMQRRDHLPRNSGDRAPRGSQGPHRSSRAESPHFTKRCGKDLGTPYICACPEKCRTDSAVLSS
jgi:hypothetical protein